MHEAGETSRRRFIQNAMVLAGTSLIRPKYRFSEEGRLSGREARFYTKLAEKKIQCELCPWRCIVKPGERGRCEVRENVEGKYISLVYGRIAAHHNDPIEKKPFYHFLPGTHAFSVATAGCNVDCKFCQNWELAQQRPEDLPNVIFSPDELIRYAVKWGCASIAYTYNEPTVFNEFVYDVANLGKTNGVRNVVISNGYINREPLLALCKVIDAYKVDLKAFTESYYRDVVGGRLAPVLDTLVTLKRENVWTEIVYLVVPTLNDDTSSVMEMVKWIVRELGRDVPLHFSRFYPKYRLQNLPPTPVPTLERLRMIALDEGLRYVYLGNVPGHDAGNTMCPQCGKLLIQRVGYRIYVNEIREGCCRFCGRAIAGIW